MTKLRLLFLILTAITAIYSSPAMAGSVGGGGGDFCEDRVAVIRNELFNWIAAGNASRLKLPPELSHDAYAKRMSEALSFDKSTNVGRVKIRCVGPADRGNGYPVLVGKTPKACRFDTDVMVDGRLTDRITCDYHKLLIDTPPAAQDTLIHHEYAGIARIESPHGDSSDYRLSNQITGFNIGGNENAQAIVDSVTKCKDLPRNARPATICLNEKGHISYVPETDDSENSETVGGDTFIRDGDFEAVDCIGDIGDIRCSDKDVSGDGSSGTMECGADVSYINGEYQPRHMVTKHTVAVTTWGPDDVSSFHSPQRASKASLNRLEARLSTLAAISKCSDMPKESLGMDDGSQKVHMGGTAWTWRDGIAKAHTRQYRCVVDDPGGPDIGEVTSVYDKTGTCGYDNRAGALENALKKCWAKYPNDSKCLGYDVDCDYVRSINLDGRRAKPDDDAISSGIQVQGADSTETPELSIQDLRVGQLIVEKEDSDRYLSRVIQVNLVDDTADIGRLAIWHNHEIYTSEGPVSVQILSLPRPEDHIRVIK